VNEKSYVGLDVKICIVCGQEYDAGILLDRRLCKTLNHRNITGLGMCEEHQKMIDEGFVHFVEARPPKNPTKTVDVVDAKDADRTGRVFHLKREVAQEIFNVDILDVQFCEPDVGDVFARLQAQSEEGDEEE